MAWLGEGMCALLCCHWAGESARGGGRKELEGKRGAVGEKDRVLEESTRLAHAQADVHIFTSALLL